MPLPELCIIGGSNSLLANGWVQQLLDVNQDTFEIRNLSIGGTTSLIGIYRLLNGDIPDGSIVLWEYAINEANHHKFGQSAESLFYHLDWFLELCARRNIAVLPLVFWNGDEQVARQQHDYRRRICTNLAQRGLRPMDFGPLLQDFVARKGQDVRAFHSDAPHYKLGTGFPRFIATQAFRSLRAARIPDRLPAMAGRDLHMLPPPRRRDCSKTLQEQHPGHRYL